MPKRRKAIFWQLHVRPLSRNPSVEGGPSESRKLSAYLPTLHLLLTGKCVDFIQKSLYTSDLWDFDTWAFTIFLWQWHSLEAKFLKMECSALTSEEQGEVCWFVWCLWYQRQTDVQREYGKGLGGPLLPIVFTKIAKRKHYRKVRALYC